MLLLFSVPLWAQSGKPVYTRQVYFEFGKYDLRPDDNKTFTAFLRAVKAQGEGYSITLIGHTDLIDNDNFNSKLGFNRAKAVKKFLITKGVPATTIKIESKGEKLAQQTKVTDSIRALNRKVEMALYAGKGVTSTTNGQTAEIKLGGHIYDAETKKLIKATISVTIKNPREVDRDKIKTYKQADEYEQVAIAERTYSVYVTADGYRAENYFITIPANQKSGTIIQDAYLKKLTIKRRLSYEKIYFVPNKDEFLPTAADELEKLLKFMQHDSTINIEIRGHINYPKNRTPMTPLDEFLFYDLSLRRAIAVYNHLTTNGIKAERMSYRGMSNSEMVMPYARTLEESMRNMRVEVLVLN